MNNINTTISMIIVDNFYNNPDEIVDSIHSRGTYEQAYASSDEVNKKMIKLAANNHETVRNIDYVDGGRDQWQSSTASYKEPWVRKKFEKIIGKKINKEHFHNGPTIWNGRLLAKLKGSDVSFHNHDNKRRGILHDNNDVGPNGWSAVVFLNKKIPIKYGFMTGQIKDDVKYTMDKFTPYITKDSIFLREEVVLKDSFIGNVYNRAVLFRGNVFHTGTEGLGEKIEDSRIIQGFFFKEKQETFIQKLYRRLKQ